MVMPIERDFAPGHPSSPDFDPKSPEAREWARQNFHPLGERDFPVDHPKALDTKGNLNHVAWVPGVDPLHPELEEFSGRTPEQAQAAREAALELAERSKPTVDPEPIVAPPPPKPSVSPAPAGQPGD